jgi:ABC-type glycerol-3-phosphate transport system substrate-binding protein
MKRMTIVLAVLVAFSMLLSACGGGATPTAAPATDVLHAPH